MKVLVTGASNWADEKAIERELKKLPQGTVVVHGASGEGAEALTDKIAMKLGLKIRRYPVESTPEEDDGRSNSVGPKRNARMIREEHRSGDPIAFALAFTPDLSRSRGAKDCVERARKAGIKVEVVTR